MQTPLAQARSTMERHGFSCWAGLSDNRGDYLHCTALKRKNQACADKLTVKFHYDARRIIDCEVTVEQRCPIAGPSVVDLVSAAAEAER